MVVGWCSDEERRAMVVRGATGEEVQEIVVRRSGKEGQWVVVGKAVEENR